MRQEKWQTYDGTVLTLSVWDEVARPKGIVQLVHGMNEHLGRYDDFARYLNAMGYIVAGDDHRAHGATAGSREAIGKVGAASDLFANTVRDEREITRELTLRYGLPIVIFGHSYGSFLTQSYMFRGTVLDGVRGFVLCGAAKQPASVIAAGRLFSLGDPDSPATTIARATFGSYDRHFGAGKNAWLTKDTEIVDRYNADAYTVDVFSKGFYRSFFRGMREIYRDPEVMPFESIPVLLMCGADDGVGGYGKYSTALYRWLRKIGVKDLTFSLYPNDRHELLNEADRAHVYAETEQFVARCFQ